MRGGGGGVEEMGEMERVVEINRMFLGRNCWYCVVLRNPELAFTPANQFLGLYFKTRIAWKWVYFKTKDLDQDS